MHPLGELRAVVGKPFSVICPAAGYPLERVTWTKGELVVGVNVEHWPSTSY